jgi:hypothetical protein
MVTGLLLARRVLDPPQRQLRQQKHQTPTPLRRQRLPNRLGRRAAHGAIQASARLREAPCSPESATRRILSTYKRYLLWDIELGFKRLKSLIGLAGPPGVDQRSAKPWILAHLLAILLLEPFVDELEDSPRWPIAA